MGGATGEEAQASGAAPRLAIGITGHRPDRLGSVDGLELTDRIAAVLRQLAERAGPCRLVTSLAEGADSYAADAAFALGWPVDVVLPFAPATNQEDFAEGAARDALQQRLARAHAVFALNGDRANGSATFAYERAGRVMLGQADLVLAIWDGGPSRGRGGAPQIIAEAVAAGTPVLHVDPHDRHPPLLLWDGLDAEDRGQQSVEHVPRAGLDRLADVVAHLCVAPVGQPTSGRGSQLALAYPLLLAATGVRRIRRSDLSAPALGASAAALRATVRGVGAETGLGQRLHAALLPAFAAADAAATASARLFRSAYVSNFALAALAVIAALSALVLPAALKAPLVIVELLIVTTIIVMTRIGNRAGWHRAWLDNRMIAERLRCLALSAQLGDLALHMQPPGAVRAVARSLGLPSLTVDQGYLGRVHDDLLRMIDDQAGYLAAEARRMRTLEHRLHRAGTALFGATAAICVAFLLIEIVGAIMPGVSHSMKPYLIWGTIGSAAFPAVGAAIYGVRMQGDFAGIAQRNDALGSQLLRLQQVSCDEPLEFDGLLRRVRRLSALLNQDLSSWRQTYDARPLTLPG